MAGGTWTTQNKDRAGVYINTVSEPKPLGTIGERGIVGMALQLPWGPEKKLITIEAGSDTFKTLGFDISDPTVLLVREALKRAKTLLLYRLNEGVKASATADALTVTAKYSGKRGNDISVVIQNNIDDPTKFDVKTLLDGIVQEIQTVSDIEGLKSNDWVTFSGTGTLTPSAGVPLTGGTDGTVTNADHTAFLQTLELQDFHTVALPLDDAQLKAVYTAFVKRLREDEGKKVQAVLVNHPTADYEGVISVKNGVVLSDGTQITPDKAVAWVAGATAGAEMNQALTYSAYDDAVDVSPRYTNSQIITALRNGEFLFTPSDGKAVVEKDINTLHSFTIDKSQKFSKNRVVRVLDGIANDIKRIFEQFYIGKVDNNDDGRNLLRSEIISYLTTLQNLNAIQNFDSQNDVIVLPGNDSDSVYVELPVQPVDSVEKIYMKVRVK